MHVKLELKNKFYKKNIKKKNYLHDKHKIYLFFNNLKRVYNIKMRDFWQLLNVNYKTLS